MFGDYEFWPHRHCQKLRRRGQSQRQTKAGSGRKCMTPNKWVFALIEWEWELLIKSQHQNWAQTLCFSSWNMEFRDKRKEQSKREIKAIEREQINKQNYLNEDNGSGFRVPPSPNSYFLYTLYKKMQLWLSPKLVDHVENARSFSSNLTILLYVKFFGWKFCSLSIHFSALKVIKKQKEKMV